MVDWFSDSPFHPAHAHVHTHSFTHSFTHTRSRSHNTPSTHTTHVHTHSFTHTQHTHTQHTHVIAGDVGSRFGSAGSPCKKSGRCGKGTRCKWELWSNSAEALGCACRYLWHCSQLCHPQHTSGAQSSQSQHQHHRPVFPPPREACSVVRCGWLVNFDLLVAVCAV